MCSKYNNDEKNVVLVSLVFLSDVLSKKNVCEACPVKNYWSVVQMPLIDDFCYFSREQKLYNTCDNFCDVLDYCG
jgi:hypothetical protein